MSIKDEVENALLEKTWQLINSEFEEHNEPGEYFHYTSLESQKIILESQSFHASLIRSSSDTLEFALPMSACRDWVLERMYSMPNFPINFFKHFNEQAISPYIRPYFVSMCKSNEAKHLQGFYGESIVKVAVKEDLSKFNRVIRLVQCKYVKNAHEEVYRIMDKWKKDVFHSVMDEFKIADPLEKDLHNSWFYILMTICNSISVAIKQDAFFKEDEVRLLFYVKDPEKGSDWHYPWGYKEIERSLVRREYLPINMNALSIELLSFTPK